MRLCMRFVMLSWSASHHLSSRFVTTHNTVTMIGYMTADRIGVNTHGNYVLWARRGIQLHCIRP